MVVKQIARLKYLQTCFLCRKFNPQECDLCPLAFHKECLQPVGKLRRGAKRLVCPRHYCSQCDKTSSKAGGLLYCCTTCIEAFCEECLDWAQTDFVGEYPAHEALGYFPKSVFYIKCAQCHEQRKRHPGFGSVVPSKKMRCY